MREYKITAGEKLMGARIPMGGVVTMRDKVDRETLEKAVNLTATRLPFLETELIYRDEVAYLVENGKHAVVTEGTKPPALGSAEANGHEITYSCIGDKIYFLYNHMVCDGHGFALVNDTVIRNYCRLYYGVALEGGLLSMDEAPTGEECADPYTYAVMPDPPIPDFEIPEAFLPPQEDLLPEGHAKAYHMRIPKEDVFRVLGTLDGSPSVLISLLISRALDAVYPDRDKTIVPYTAVDARAALGCRKTVQNCVTSAYFVYSDRVKKLPIGKQLTCFRGMLLRQTDPDYLHQKMVKQAREYEAMVNSRRLKKPQAVTETAVTGTILVTYVGNVNLNNLDEYRKGFTMLDSHALYKISVGMTEMGGVFRINLSSRLSSEKLYDAFIQQLNEVGLSYEADPTEIISPAAL